MTTGGSVPPPVVKQKQQPVKEREQVKELKQADEEEQETEPDQRLSVTPTEEQYMSQDQDMQEHWVIEDGKPEDNHGDSFGQQKHVGKLEGENEEGDYCAGLGDADDSQDWNESMSSATDGSETSTHPSAGKRGREQTSRSHCLFNYCFMHANINGCWSQAINEEKIN